MITIEFVNSWKGVMNDVHIILVDLEVLQLMQAFSISIPWLLLVILAVEIPFIISNFERKHDLLKCKLSH